MKKLLAIILFTITCLFIKAQDTARYKAEDVVIYTGEDSVGTTVADSTEFALWQENEGTLKVISIGRTTFYALADRDSIRVHQLDPTTTLFIFPLYVRITGDYYGRLGIVIMDGQTIIISISDGIITKVYNVKKL